MFSTHTHTHTHTHTNSHTQTQTHIHTPTHMHTHSLSLSVCLQRLEYGEVAVTDIVPGTELLAMHALESEQADADSDDDKADADGSADAEAESEAGQGNDDDDDDDDEEVEDDMDDDFLTTDDDSDMEYVLYIHDARETPQSKGAKQRCVCLFVFVEALRCVVYRRAFVNASDTRPYPLFVLLLYLCSAGCSRCKRKRSKNTPK